MRILIGTDDGLHLMRWLAGERAGTSLSHSFAGNAVTSLARSGEALYAALPEQGVMGSRDRAGSWEPEADLPTGLRALTLASPAPGDLVVGTEPAALLHGSDGTGSWRRLDGFDALSDTETWTEYGARAAHVQTIALEPHDGRRLYAGVEIGGAYRSDDGGATWLGINDGVFDDIHDLVVDPKDASRLHAATGGGLYVSTDRGADWRPVAGDVGSAYCTRLAVAPRGRGPDPAVMLLGTAEGPKAGGSLWVSRDGGSSWGRVETKHLKGGNPVTAIAIDPSDPGGVLVGTSGGHLVHGNLQENRWHQLSYGLQAVRAILIL